MSDLTINCPHCNQSLEVPEEMLGQVTNCPSCNTAIQLPLPQPPPLPKAPKMGILLPIVNPVDVPPVPVSVSSPTVPLAATPDIQMRQCPFCGEDIRAVAIKCKHCGSDLTQIANPQKPLNKGSSTGYKSETFGVITIALPIGCILLGFVLPAVYTISSILMVIATSILISVEASKVGAGSADDLRPNGKKYEGPIAWLVLGFLLWIVAFPYWMARRAKYGLKNLCAGAVVIAMFVVGVNVFVSTRQATSGGATASSEQEQGATAQSQAVAFLLNDPSIRDLASGVLSDAELENAAEKLEITFGDGHLYQYLYRYLKLRRKFPDIENIYNRKLTDEARADFTFSVIQAKMFDYVEEANKAGLLH